MKGARVLSAFARLSKLRAMSATEIVHRIRYAGTLAIERRQHRTQGLAHPDRLRNALAERFRAAGWERRLLESRGQNRGRFFRSVSAPDAMRSLFASAYHHERAATLEHAARARRHQFEFFGRQFEYGEDIDWQSDPLSGRRWPSVYHADVPVHGGDVGFGDVKYVWELSRQQYLIDLSKAWCLARSPEDVDAIRRLVRSWIMGNPYATGVNWSCALEPAFRVFSWLWAYHLTVEALDDEFHLEWLRGFYDHGRFIERHLEHYSSPYNHLIAEAAALYMLGTCFPEFRDAERWRAGGRAVLEGRLAGQFYADGGSVEQSTFYHHATVGFYLMAAILAQASGDDLSPEVWRAIERGIEFSMALSQPDGKTPPIGGADDGKPIRMEHLPLWDFRPYQAIGAVLFNRPDFKHVAGRFHEDALWLLGPAGLEQFDALARCPPRESSTWLASSGYYLMRSGWSERADYVCLDCGEQAAGMRTDSVPNSMHGHADCLSVVVWLDGRRVLVDSGLYAYNCGGAWEAHFRETAAHNTAQVDGRDQARHIRSMAWTHSYRAVPEGWHAGAQEAWAIGSHDGYARGPTGVVHRRAVWLRPGSYLLIYDEFVGTGEHELSVNYQFASGALKGLGEGGVLFDRAVDLLWAGSETWSGEVTCGGPEPGDGWIAPSLGIRQAAPRLTLRCTTNGPRTSLVTVIASRTAGESRVALVEAGRSQALVLVSGDDYTDCVAAAGIAPPEPIETDALLAVCRMDDAGVLTSNGIKATRLQVDGEAVGRLCARAPAPLAVSR